MVTDSFWLEVYDQFCLDIDDDILEECDELYDPREDRYYVRAAQLYCASHGFDLTPLCYD